MNQRTSKPTQIVLRQDQFPAYVIYRGDRGQETVYEIKQAGRKFGLSLQAVSQWTRDLLLRRD